MKHVRRCGVLLHISSLPSRHGLGDFGPQAHGFVDFLGQAGQSVWQVLPLAPINAGAGNSPYSSYSAFAGNVLFISPDLLVRQGVLRTADLDQVPFFPVDRVDYGSASSWRMRLLEQAFDSVFPQLRSDCRFQNFCSEEKSWLDDFCLFMALKTEQNGAPWYRWPQELRLRDASALEATRSRLGYDIVREKYYQYLFAQQWADLRRYASTQGVSLLGDVPIYVSLDSSDVWAHRELFQLDDGGLPVFSAGAPPDYFSETGQMWGNPVYEWAFHEGSGFSWWIDRLAHENQRFDMVRLDHFRGFCGYWQVPSCEPTAENGVWISGPGARLFTSVRERIPDLNLIAEDLGVITPDVTELMDEFGFPGMKILQFAFSPDMGRNAYIPHNMPRQSVVYTGTHDNNTTRGWFLRELDESGRQRLHAYAGRKVDERHVAEVLIRMALGSPADLSIIPMQDYMNLGEDGRMNMPGVAGGNWEWRMRPDALTTEMATHMRFLADIFGRLRE